jgi:hypothetical protein
VPLAKPQITLRRPGVSPQVAEAFVTGGEVSATAASSPTPAAPSSPPAAEGQGSGSSAATSGGHLALVSERRPDVQVSGGSDVRPLRAGIIQRRSGRARRRTTVYFDPQLARTLKIYCATNGIELSDFVDSIVRGHFERQSSPNTVPDASSGLTE